MPHTYLVDVQKIIDDLSKDDGLMLEERLVLLSMITDYTAEVSKKLEDKLAGETGETKH
jgi:hypothetical protein